MSLPPSWVFAKSNCRFDFCSSAAPIACPLFFVAHFMILTRGRRPDRGNELVRTHSGQTCHLGRTTAISGEDGSALKERECAEFENVGVLPTGHYLFSGSVGLGGDCATWPFNVNPGLANPEFE